MRPTMIPIMVSLVRIDAATGEGATDFVAIRGEIIPAIADPAATARTLARIHTIPFTKGWASETKKSSVGMYAAQIRAKMLDGLVQLWSCTLPSSAMSHITN